MSYATLVKAIYMAGLFTFAIWKNNAGEFESYDDYNSKICYTPAVHEEMDEEAYRCGIGGTRYYFTDNTHQLVNNNKASKRGSRFAHLYHVRRNQLAHGYIPPLLPWDLYSEFQNIELRRMLKGSD